MVNYLIRVLVLFSFLSPLKCFKVTQISTKTSPIPGSGMDSCGMWSLFCSDGRFSVKICQSGVCCDTGALNTEDNNWELDQTDWFVGRQIGDCNGAVLDTNKDIEMILEHQGSDGGLLEWVRIHSWDPNMQWECPVREKLDHSENYRTRCALKVLHSNPSKQTVCNGNAEFCKLTFDQFLFPGSHNSGTGQSQGSFQCGFKNQDLNIVEQLEFGIRFLDIDSIKTDLSGCNGLETGHGKSPELMLYQCYGQMSSLLSELRRWMDAHPSEVVVVNFGNIQYPEETIPALLETLKEIFPPVSTSVKLNSQYKRTGKWPTLGEAVESNERIFVFIRDTIGAISGNNHPEVVKEIKVKPTDIELTSKNRSDATVMSSYEAKSVGDDCSYLMDTNELACLRDKQLHPDFLKLSFFSAFGKGGTFRTECIHKMARKCNVWPASAVRECANVGLQFRPNFILLDYPNYQSEAELTIIQLCNEINLERAQMVSLQTDN